jgi:hypothetical protein
MHRLIQINSKLLLGLHSRRKSLFPPLHLIRCLLRPKFIMDDFECSSFFDGAVCCGAIRTVDNFARSCIDGFAQGESLHVFKVGATETFEVGTPIDFFKEDTGTCLTITLDIRCHDSKKNTHLAYTLKNGYCVFEIANVEHWDYQFDVGIVPYAVNRRQPTRLTKCVLLSRTLQSSHISSRVMQLQH